MIILSPFTFLGLIVPRRPVVTVVVVDGDLLPLGDVPAGHEAHDVAEPRVHQDRFKIAVWLVERAEIDISAGSILTTNNHKSTIFRQKEQFLVKKRFLLLVNHNKSF